MGSMFRLQLTLPYRKNAHSSATAKVDVDPDGEWRLPVPAVGADGNRSIRSATVNQKAPLPSNCVQLFQASDPNVDVNGNRVLIVEDHCALALLTQRQLQRNGYDVRVAHSGKEAEQQTAGWTPTSVIMDLALPDTCGMALCRRMKSLPEFATCRFIAYSGRSETNDQDAAFAAGFDDYLLKPAGPAALQAVVH